MILLNNLVALIMLFSLASTSTIELPPLNLIKVSLGDDIDLDFFRCLSYDQEEILISLDTKKLQDIYISTVCENNLLLDYHLKITNENSIVKSVYGEYILISKVSLNSNYAFFEIFNPSRIPIDLNSVEIIVNNIEFTFSSQFYLKSNESFYIQLSIGTNTSSVIDPNFPSISLPLFESIQVSSDSSNVKDIFNFNPFIMTTYGLKDINEFYFIRNNKIINPESTFNYNSWIPKQIDIPLVKHTLPIPRISTNDQAKAWAEDVLFGRGMNALGREEEAFFTIHKEYEYMDELSKYLINAYPLTEISGVDENNVLVSKTFLDAKNRYNYLASKFPSNSHNYNILLINNILSGTILVFIAYLIYKNSNKIIIM